MNNLPQTATENIIDLNSGETLDKKLDSVDTEISDINNKLVITSGSDIVVRDSGARISACTYHKYGNLVFMTLHIVPSTSVAVQDDVFSGHLIDGFIPLERVTTATYNRDNSVPMIITNEGSITVRNAGNSNIPSSSNLYFGLCFLVA